jgi:hypothetical protein
MSVCHSTAEPRNRVPAPDTEISPQHKDFMLAAVRCAKLRVQSLALELDEIGVALSHNMISAEGAVSWIYYIGANQFVNVEPFTNKIALLESGE